MYRVIISFLLLLVASCAVSDRVNVTETNFTDQGELKDLYSIKFEFDKIMIPSEMIGKTSANNPLKIYPEQGGNLYWQNNNTLVFYPHGGFKANTDYIIEFTENLLDYMPVKSQMPIKRIYRFHTTYTKVNEMTLNWHKGSQNSPIYLVCDLNFNTAANFLDITKNGKVTIGKKDFTISSNRWEIANKAKMSILIDDVLEVEGKNLKFSIPFEIERSEGKKDTHMLEASATVPLLSDFSMTEIVVKNTIERRGIMLSFNQSLNPKIEVKKLVKTVPQVSYEYEIYGNELYLNGNFAAEQSYTIMISSDLESIFGVNLPGDVSQDVFIPKAEPQIVLNDPDAIYLSSRGNRLLGLRIAAIDELVIKTHKIFENNLIRALWGYQSIDYTYGYEPMSGNWYEMVNIAAIGTTIAERTYRTTDLPSSENVQLLEFRINDFTNVNGIYLLEIYDKNNPSVRQVMYVALSDLGLIAKWGRDDITVFANSLVTTEPIAGATIKLISRNNQIIETSRTDASGVAKLRNDKKDLPGYTPAIVKIEYGTEHNYLFLDGSNMIPKYRFNVTGGYEPTDYYAFMYGDRDLYRPGENLIINGIVRDAKLKLLGDLTLKLSIQSASGFAFKDYKVRLNEQGNFEIREELPLNMQTGVYSAVLMLPNDNTIGTYRFFVEEFTPDRLKITATTDKDDYRTGEEIKFNIQTDYLFGMPAASMEGSIAYTLTNLNFESEDYPDYNFTLSGMEQIYNYDYKEFRTNEKGNTIQIYNLSEYLNNRGVLKLFADIGVVDETGNENKIYLTRKAYTQDVFAGIGMERDWYELNKSVNIPVVVLDKDGKKATSGISIEIYKVSYNTALRSSASYDYRYESYRIENMISTQTLTVSGEYVHKFTPMSSGEYEIRIRQNNSESFVGKVFYVYRYGFAESAGFQIDKEGRITITADKQEYIPGESARLLFKAPFDGKLIVTVEREGVFEHYTLRTQDNTASLNLPIKSEFNPNIYISAILIKAITNNNFPLNVAYGYKELKIIDTKKFLPIEIIADETTRSGGKKTIRVRTLPERDINVTIAATDEGILQIKRFKTPAAYEFFYSPRMLNVATYSAYSKLYGEYTPRSGAFGGGDEGFLAMADFHSPFFDKAVKLLSFWSGNLKTNASGMAEFTIDLPQFSGALRIMAVAYKGDRFGSSEKMMKISDPLIVTPSVPKFLSKDDEADIRINLKNLTNAKKNVKLEVKTEGDLHMELATKQISLDGSADVYIDGRIAAGSSLGTRKITITATDGTDKYSIERYLTVRLASNIEIKTLFGDIKPGETKSLKAHEGFITEYSRSILAVSRQPFIEFFSGIDFLTDYPYGCSEQVISSAFPLLVYKDFREYARKGNVQLTDAGVAQRINDAIGKIASLQDFDGGVGLWVRGENELWVSIYALHFLVEARNKGYRVNDGLYNTLVKYIRSVFSMADNYESNNMGLNSLGKDERYMVASYACYVFARAGVPERALMNFYAEDVMNMPYEAKVILASSFLLSGNVPAFYALMPSTIESNKIKSESPNIYGSRLRELALTAYAYSVARGNDLYSSKLANLLVSELRRRKDINTQEAAFTLLAISNFMSGDGQHSSFEIKGKRYDLNGSTNIFNEQLNGGIEVKNTGNSSIWYFVRTKGFTAEEGKTEKSDFVSVERILYNQNGTRITPNNLKAGDRVFVKIKVKLKDGLKEIRNLAVSDMIPGCWDIENPRLTNRAKPSWLGNVNEAGYTDIREDRINIFADVSGSAEFMYVARVVTSGVFRFGPLTAIGMYNPEVQYSGKTEKIQVAKRIVGGV